MLGAFAGLNSGALSGAGGDSRSALARRAVAPPPWGRLQPFGLTFDPAIHHEAGDPKAHRLREAARAEVVGGNFH